MFSCVSPLFLLMHLISKLWFFFWLFSSWSTLYANFIFIYPLVFYFVSSKYVLAVYLYSDQLILCMMSSTSREVGWLVVVLFSVLSLSKNGRKKCSLLRSG